MTLPCTQLVSIIIPTLNRRGLLMQTLDSLCDQTYPHWEAVVVDDGSTDGTEVMMERFCRWEPRIRYTRRTGRVCGAPVCRILGFEAAHGEYIVFLDSDDLLAPECLEGRLTAMQADGSLDFAVFMAEVFDTTPGDVGLCHNVFTPTNDLDRFLCRDFPWATTSPIWRRQALLRVGLYREDLPRLQDWDLSVRALICSCRYAKVDRRDWYIRSASGGGALRHRLCRLVEGTQ